jgi:hypothetical protein
MFDSSVSRVSAAEFVLRPKPGMQEFNGLISGGADIWNARELIVANLRSRLDRLMECLEEPLAMDSVHREQAKFILQELRLLEESDFWGKKTCLIDAETDDILDHCHPRFAGHLALFGTESGECRFLGFSKAGIFVRDAGLGWRKLCGDEVMAPYIWELQQLNPYEPADDPAPYVNIQETAYFRSKAVKQTQVGEGAFELRDLTSDASIVIPVGIRANGKKGPYYPRFLSIKEVEASAADYERSFGWLRNQLEVSIQRPPEPEDIPLADAKAGD